MPLFIIVIWVKESGWDIEQISKSNIKELEERNENKNVKS